MKRLLFAAALMMTVAFPAAAQTVLQFALPTPEAHPRNQAIALWTKAVATVSAEELVIALRHGVTDYEGARIPAAVAEGVYDMAAPGWWHVARYTPEFGLSALPMFYGRDADTVHGIFDGETGMVLNEKLEQALSVRVIGRRLDLGFGHIYLTGETVKGYEGLQDRNIRVPGGGADLARYLAFGATPRRVAMGDLANALERQLIDGLLVTHNFVADASLWTVGVRHALLDNQVFYQYTPIINRVRWESLFDENRAWLSQSWEATIDEMRRFVVERQMRARALATKNGVTYVEMSPDQRQSMRSTLMEEQKAVGEALEIDPELVARVKSLLERAAPKN